MTRQIVCKVSDVELGRLTSAKIGRAPLVLSRLPSGEIKAFSGRCPHQGAALSAGCIAGFATSDEPNLIAIERPGEIVRCPWHGFEWDIETGMPLVPEGQMGSLRLRFYSVEIDGDNVVVVT